MEPSQPIEVRSLPGGAQHLFLRTESGMLAGNCHMARSRRVEMRVFHWSGRLGVWAEQLVAEHPGTPMQHLGLCMDCFGRSARSVVRQVRAATRAGGS